ncbi:MAG: hypothetical protein V4732_15720 [Pseudomonadota bacterium]
MNSLLKLLLLLSCMVLANFSVAQAETHYFFGLENLHGVWQVNKPESEREKAFQLKYHLISKDKAFVEVYGDPAKQTTETIFYRDGKDLMATHYCARGNQPRLKMFNSAQKNTVEFKFQDITNLSNKNDAHMVRMKFTFIDKDHFEKEEVYLVNGKEEASSMSLVRVN